MTPSELKDIVQAAVEDVGCTFMYGTESDAWLNKLESGDVLDGLNKNGYVHYSMPLFQAIQVNDAENSETYPLRLIICKQAQVGDKNNTDSIALITDCYNLKQDIVESITTNNTLLTLIEKEWTPFIYGDNVTTGVRVEFEVMAKFC